MSRHLWLPIFMGAGKVAVFEPETSAYLLTIGIPNDGTVFYPATPQEITGAQIWTLVNNYVLALKAADIAGFGWTNFATATGIMYRDYPMIGGTAPAHSYNLANPSAPMTYFGSWVHNQLGAIGNGANTYGIDGFRNGDLAVINAVYAGGMQVDLGASGSTFWLHGSRQSAGAQELAIARSGGTIFSASLASAITFTSATLTGDFAKRRVNQSGINTFNYINGVQVRQDDFSNTVVPVALDHPLGALNQGGSFTLPFNGEIRHHFIANEITLAQHNAWHAARVALQTALNRLP